MAASMWQVRDELWEVVAPRLPVHEPDPGDGRPRVDDRVCFGAIVFVLFTGIAWQHLPRELGCSRRLRIAGYRSGRPPGCSPRCTPSCCGASTWPGRSTGLRRSSMPATSVLFKGALTGPSPVDRARTGSKHHLLTDSGGIPLAISLTGGHRNDVTQLLPLIDDVGPVRGRSAVRASALNGCSLTVAMTTTSTAASWKRGVKPVIARRQTANGSGLGRQRWVVERTFAHLHNLRGCGPATSVTISCTWRPGRRPSADHTDRGSPPIPRSPPGGAAAAPIPTPGAGRPCRPVHDSDAPSDRRSQR